MPDVACVNHMSQRAVGFCSRCQKSYCSDCLDMEMGQPICADCKKQKSAGPAAIPSGGLSSLNFKGKGLDDDPLGLMGAPTKPKMDAPPVAPIAAPAPQAVPKPAATSLPPSLDFGMSSMPTPKVVPPSVGFGMASTAAPKPSAGNLDGLLNSSQPLPAFSKTSAPSALPLSGPAQPQAGKAPSKLKFLSLGKLWVKFLIRKGYEKFEPMAKMLHVPTFVVVAGIPLLLAGLVLGGVSFLNRPSVNLVPAVTPINLVLVSSAQVSEMDITTFSDYENQLQAMGFSPLLQMTIPQIPSPNFFDVVLKADAGTYGEILKLPGEITPHLSFVTVFTNGVWFSTNAWKGENHQSESILSEFYPTDTPDQLYVKHIQELDKLKQENGWEVETQNQNRYMAALSDRLRGFLAKRDIPAYKADFASWH